MGFSWTGEGTRMNECGVSARTPRTFERRVADRVGQQCARSLDTALVGSR